MTNECSMSCQRDAINENMMIYKIHFNFEHDSHVFVKILTHLMISCLKWDLPNVRYENFKETFIMISYLQTFYVFVVLSLKFTQICPDLW